MREETSIGVFEFSGNEIKLDATIEDAPKVRQGVSDPRQHALGCLSGDRLVSGRREEKVLCILKHEDAVGGYYRFMAQRPGTTDDANMIALLDLFTDRAVFYVPVVFAAGGPPEAPPPPPLPTPQPPQGAVHGIAPGDFATIRAVYGFASDDEQAYRSGALSWREVLDRMDRRDDYRHFAPGAP